MYIEKIVMPREMAYRFNDEFNFQVKSKGFMTLEEVYYLLLLTEIENELEFKEKESYGWNEEIKFKDMFKPIKGFRGYIAGFEVQLPKPIKIEEGA